MKPKKIFWLILIITLGAIFVDLPKEFNLNIFFPGSKIGLKDIKIEQKISRPALEIKLRNFRFYRDLEIKKGIDLAGGVHLVFQADMSNIPSEDKKSALEATRNNIEKRINLYGVSEAVVQTSQKGEDYRVIVELPGIKDISQAIELIGKTAQLDFRELPQEATTATSLADFKSTGLTGKDLTRSKVEFDPNTGQPVVGLEFSAEGGKKFAEITKRNINKPVAIFLDDLPLTIPLVKEEITTGKAVISGDFDLKSAKNLSIQLNAGALPVPIKVVEQRSIGASLGEESVRKSIQAGFIGLGLVALFMISYYGYLGFLAVCGLVIYGLLSLALYKLIPVTLTLPGIAGFLLSIGMAVDSNILIFERMKEEIRMGKPKKLAMELGFGRAWDSIRDANVCTLITCFILFNPFNWNFLNTSGMVRGFALTLGLGVLLSLFTGIVVTRTILRVFSFKEEK
ncbi:MAG: protein translocase subunit SecD [Microgenomates group bacterium]